MTLLAREDATLPDQAVIEAAAETRRQLAAFLSTKLETQRVDIVDVQDQVHTVQLPAMALQLLDEVLSELALGNAVKIVPIHAELTTQEAADLLNVSRPYLVKLLDEGRIAHTKLNRHRRVKFADLMAYKKRQDANGRKALDELSELSQDVDMGYE
ncbi:helix-turn-helix domain-containing protein [Pseudomonas sp. NPDC088444]|uniref:helix-turn-helix domain-containing protein n=1 Tax=Pseudomonas sp. NPDC088444 TaxID=3364456 RepID=UPI00384E288D